MMTTSSRLNELRPWSAAAVRLLQGAAYHDDASVWDALLAHRSQLEEYFSRLGLQLLVDEGEGLAFLRQCDEDELPPGGEMLPKLFRRSTLSYPVTVLCVMLRDVLRQFDEEELDQERCVVETAQLLDDWKAFFPAEADEVRQLRELSAALRKLEEMKFVRPFSDDPPTWEVRRILKAKLPAAELEQLRSRLQAALAKRDAQRSRDD